MRRIEGEQYWRTFMMCERVCVQTFLRNQPLKEFLANVLRYVRYMLSAVRLLSVCCLSVCDVGAPYTGG